MISSIALTPAFAGEADIKRTAYTRLIIGA